MERNTERFTCENPSLTAIELWIEPSGMCFSIPPSERLEVICEGPHGGRLEFDHHPEGHITVFSWSGAEFTVFKNGVEIYNEQGIRTPPCPPQVTLRQLIEVLFGDFETRRQMRRSS